MEDFMKQGFQIRKCLLSLERGGEPYFVPVERCSYQNIKSTASQLKKKGVGAWKVSKKKVGIDGKPIWVNGTYITRER